MYELCPDPYYSNCSFSIVGCSSCKASCPSLDLPLRYKPIDPSLTRKDHPCSLYLGKKNKEALRQSKIERADDIKRGRKSRNSGAKNERKVASKLDAQFTEASGAKYGDGDLVIEAGPLSFNMECKYRGDGRNESGPTKKEWEKAVSRSIPSFCTTSKSYPNGVITLTFELFTELIDLIRECYDNERY